MQAARRLLEALLSATNLPPRRSKRFAALSSLRKQHQSAAEREKHILLEEDHMQSITASLSVLHEAILGVVGEA